MDKTLQGKQFRAPRANNGKLIKNRIGGYDRSHCRCDYCLGISRGRLMRQAIERETKEALIAGLEEVDYGVSSSYACGDDVPTDGSFVLDELDGNGSDLTHGVLVVRYRPDGKMASAHVVDFDEAQRLQGDLE